MKTLLWFIVLIIDVLSYRYNGFPQRTVMFGGYYPRSRGSSGSVTFASGDTIATNYQTPFDIQSSVEETTDRRIVPNFEEEPEVAKPKRKPPKEEESDEEDNNSWPFGSSKGGNVFFPIMLGGRPNLGRRSDDQGYYPGAATAIANSFSTGKGGVATSHATSFGDPYLSTLFRNGNFNKKAKPAYMND